MIRALLYEKTANQTVRCNVCNHHCTIVPNHRGICGVRINEQGELYLLVYGKAISEAVDPIEKKPFFNFLPGSQALSVAAIGCNFRCDNCQNWQISQAAKTANMQDAADIGNDLSPDRIVADAVSHGCASIAYTYTEPTVWMEYALECMKLAKKKKLKNIWVSNGYMSEATLRLITPYLDAINVDLKFFDHATYQKNCGARLDPILENLKTIKQSGIWLEITTLAIPTLSDTARMFTKMARFIHDELGPDTPWHISAFSSSISYKLQKLPATETATLQKAYEIGRKTGLRYVYTGNVPGLDSENTYCPQCQALIIKRLGYTITRLDSHGTCPQCQKKLALII